jgi:hypothetical protein
MAAGGLVTSIMALIVPACLPGLVLYYPGPLQCSRRDFSAPTRRDHHFVTACHLNISVFSFISLLTSILKALPSVHQENPKFTFCTFFTCCKQKKYRFWKVPPT